MPGGFADQADARGTSMETSSAPRFHHDPEDTP
jgi:hypothetical protein